MAKAKYRLQVLLNMKAMAKKRAEIALSKAIAELQKAKKYLDELKKEKSLILKRRREARSEMKRKMDIGGVIGESNVHVNFLRKLKEDADAKQDEIDDQEIYIESCESEVVRTRHDYIDAARELQVMEKHKELWEKKQRDELSRIEQREMDELGNTIHQLRRARGERQVFESH